MKKILIIGLSAVAVILLSVFLIVPIFAQDKNPPADVWQDMYQACQEGDWQAMNDTMQETHGDNGWNCHDTNTPPVQGQGNASQGGGGMMGGWGNYPGGTANGGWRGHMSGGMMGGDWSGSSGGMMGGGSIGRGGGMMSW
ncbi:MAG: hypothetical protein Q8O16_05525 [Dehalococcoidia bacterium]|nr:hypothetical protein [Dehalococcoidia bacterium]